MRGASRPDENCLLFGLCCRSLWLSLMAVVTQGAAVGELGHFNSHLQQRPKNNNNA